jgi:hypothetical protein
VTGISGKGGGGPFIAVPDTAMHPVQLFAVKLLSGNGTITPSEWKFDSAASNPPLIFAYIGGGGSMSAVITANSTAAVTGAVELTLRLTIHSDHTHNVTVAEVAFPQVSYLRASTSTTTTTTHDDVHEAVDPMANGELVSGGGVRGTGIRVSNPAHNVTYHRMQWYEYGYAPYVQGDVYPHAGASDAPFTTPHAPPPPRICLCRINRTRPRCDHTAIHPHLYPHNPTHHHLQHTLYVTTALPHFHRTRRHQLGGSVGQSSCVVRCHCSFVTSGSRHYQR